MIIRFDWLNQNRVDEPTRFRYGTITSTSPRRVQLDGDDEPLAARPVVFTRLVKGMRVFVMLWGTQAVVLGVVNGTAGDGVPVGTVLPFGGTTAPAGWLLCDGSAVSRSEYADLFTVLSTKFGAGNGYTTFNLPEMRGRVPMGYDAGQSEFNAVGKVGGSKTHNHGPGTYKAAIGATNGEVGSIGYVATTPDPAYPTVNAYSLTGMSGTSAYRQFNHHTPVGGTSGQAVGLPPFTTLNYIVKI